MPTSTRRSSSSLTLRNASAIAGWQISSMQCCEGISASGRRRRSREVFPRRGRISGDSLFVADLARAPMARKFSTGASRRLRRGQRARASGDCRQRAASRRWTRASATSVGGVGDASFVVRSRGVARATGQVSEAAGEGRWWPQSESSAMAVAVLNPQPGEAILDVCSGRGNKALQIGGRLAGEGTLLCIERDARKAATLARVWNGPDVVGRHRHRRCDPSAASGRRAVRPSTARRAMFGHRNRRAPARGALEEEEYRRRTPCHHAASAARAGGSSRRSRWCARLRSLLDGSARNDGSGGLVFGAREFRTRSDAGGVRTAVDGLPATCSCRPGSTAAMDSISRDWSVGR